MSFISQFPKRWFDVDGKSTLMPNLTKRITIPADVLNNTTLYMEYMVEDGERPDQISEKLYDTDQYWWLVLMANKITNIYEQWPRMDESIYAEMENLDDPYAISHYVHPDGSYADIEGLMYLYNVPLEYDPRLSNLNLSGNGPYIHTIIVNEPIIFDEQDTSVPDTLTLTESGGIATRMSVMTSSSFAGWVSCSGGVSINGDSIPGRFPSSYYSPPFTVTVTTPSVDTIMMRTDKSDPFDRKVSSYKITDSTGSEVLSILNPNPLPSRASDAKIAQRFNLRPVSYIDHAMETNERKRRIRLIDPDHIEVFAQYLETVLDE